MKCVIIGSQNNQTAGSETPSKFQDEFGNWIQLSPGCQEEANMANFRDESIAATESNIDILKIQNQDQFEINDAKL